MRQVFSEEFDLKKKSASGFDDLSDSDLISELIKHVSCMSDCV